jgi:hypothetical protein
VGHTIVCTEQVKQHLTAIERKYPSLIPQRGEEELERFLLAHNPRFLKILEEGERNIRETGGIPHEQFWAKVEQEAH